MRNAIHLLSENLSLYDLRTRNQNYASPEQHRVFEELTDIVVPHRNGKIEVDSYEIEEFLLLKKYQQPITKRSDIFSIGAILFKLLVGRAPTPLISTYINDNKLFLAKKNQNVYLTPFFLKDFIVSDDMCQILIKLLAENPDHRL